MTTVTQKYVLIKNIYIIVSMQDMNISSSDLQYLD